MAAPPHDPGAGRTAGTDPASPEASPAISNRGFELALALALAAVAVVVIADARRVGTGWDEFDGPRAGYFPFYVGCLLLAAASWIAVRQLLQWRGANPDFATRGQLWSVWTMVWPMGVYVALIAPLGIYLPSALLIGFFMRRHGRYGWGRIAAVAGGVPLVFFLVFERWFLVALPKGPVEALLGL